jgi:MFS superfamily sulfate permease-like transporter
VDFLSRSTITGFMGGTAAIIILQQLKGMLGMKHFTSKTDIISVVRSIFLYRDEVSEMIARISPRSPLHLPFPSQDISLQE